MPRGRKTAVATAVVAPVYNKGSLVLYKDPSNGWVEGLVLYPPHTDTISNEVFITLGPSFPGCGLVEIDVFVEGHRALLKEWTPEGVHRAKNAFIRKKKAGLKVFDSADAIPGEEESRVLEERQDFWNRHWPSNEEEENNSETDDSEEEDESGSEEAVVQKASCSRNVPKHKKTSRNRSVKQ